MRRFRLPIVALALVAAAIACGSHPPRHRDPAPAARSDPGIVVGRLLDSTSGGPLRRWTVAMGDERKGTDADGGFSFAGVPPLYDVVILDPDGSSIAIYKGLTRRDPLLLAGQGDSDGGASSEPPPVLLSPADGEVVTVATEFEWAGFKHGVYQLRLSAQTPSRETPNIDIYAADTRTRWPDLRWFGNSSFHTKATSYRCRIAAWGAFTSIDDAVGPHGIAGPLRASTPVAVSSPIALTIPEPAPSTEVTVADLNASADAVNASAKAAVDASADAPSGPPANLQFARRVTGQVVWTDRVASRLVVGERWGCVQLTSPPSGGYGDPIGGWPVGLVWDRGEGWQCWDASANAAAGGRPRAWKVPWLNGKFYLSSGVDRICEIDVVELTFRCWHHPMRGEAGPREFPASTGWLNQAHTGYEDPEAALFVGGAFDCLRTRFGEVWCVGDNRFGQLGTGTSSRPGDKGWLSVWPGAMGVGTWHACAMAARGGVQGGYLACWGRGDYGQLGAPAHDLCAVGGKDVPCNRTPQRGPAFSREPQRGARFSDDENLVIEPGDLFTCMSDREGIACWGANQDAFFGSPASCPDALRRAWPTLRAPVSAPRAACSPDPVRIAGVHAFTRDVQVGPRGMCFGQGADVRCIGAIETPIGGGFAAPKVSPGQDASACALRNGAVFCWGEAYSPPNAPATPVAIDLVAPPLEDVAVVGPIERAGWAEECAAQKGCFLVPGRVSPCPKGMKAHDWSDVLEGINAHDSSGVLASGQPLTIEPIRTFANTHIHIRGRLGVLMPQSTPAPRCKPHCCGGVYGRVVLGGPADGLLLQGLFCSGDESLACCNAPAYGESLVATGRLEQDFTGNWSSPSGWTLAFVTLCSEASPAK
jgi:hypothetical protein